MSVVARKYERYEVFFLVFNSLSHSFIAVTLYIRRCRSLVCTSVNITDDTALAIPFAIMLVFPDPEGPCTTKGRDESLVKYELICREKI